MSGRITIGVSSKAASATPMTTTAVTTQATGSTFIVGIVWNESSTFTSIADTFTNTWTEIGTEQVSGTDIRMRMYYCPNGTGGTGHQVTVTLSGDEGTVFFCEIMGAQIDGLDSTSLGIAADTTEQYEVTSGTLEQSNEILFCLLGGNTGTASATTTEWTGMSIVQVETNGTVNWCGGLAWRVAESTSAYTSSWSQLSSTATLQKIVGIKEAISVQPTNQTVYVGQTATFNITATGNGTLSYQWKDDGGNVGTNSNSYTTAATVIGDNGSIITCEITDDDGTIISDNRFLFVLPTATGAWVSA